MRASAAPHLAQQRRSLTEPRRAAVVPACLFAWLLPGGGHFYLGRTGRGLLFLLALSALFVLGVGMDARLQIYVGLEDPLLLITTWAQVAMGLPYFVAKGLGRETGLITSATYEYGLTFTAVAGLLNILVILDAHDIAVGRKA